MTNLHEILRQYEEKAKQAQEFAKKALKNGEKGNAVRWGAQESVWTEAATMLRQALETSTMPTNEKT